jgi:hypothetical protein
MPSPGDKVLSTLGAWRASADDKLYARAVPEKVEITETYEVCQEISRNRTLRSEGQPTGHIEMAIPYDGRDYFTQRAFDDVKHVVGESAPAGQRATIGHLLLADHSKTDLNKIMRLHGKAGMIPVEVPISATSGGLDQLTGDREACLIEYAYQPGDPEIIPAQFEISLVDSDSLDLLTVELLTIIGATHPARVIEQLRQVASFRTELVLDMAVRLSLPVKEGYPRLTPTVKKVSIGWPTVTTLRTTSLQLGSNPAALQKKGILRSTQVPVRYNPDRRRLEWAKVPVFKVTTSRDHGDTGNRRFRSARMLLKIGHPGELFRAEKLEVQAEVEIPNYLLSGLEARLYSATGDKQRLRPKQITRIQLSAQFWPGDVFDKRTFSPYHRVVFDEIIPSEMRISDIVSVLGSLQFEVDKPWAHPDNDPSARRWLLTARRNLGTDPLTLLIAVDGSQRAINIQRLPTDKRKITESSETGRITLSVLGALPADHQELTNEMNALHQALRERYRYQ